MKELIAIQQGLKAPKDKYNDFGKYKYRSAESILEAVKPLLADQYCTLTINDELVFVGSRYYIKATCTITNEKGEQVQTSALAREEETKKGMDASQVTGACSSYARKYALNGLFAIDDTKDADALNTSAEYTATQKTLLRVTMADYLAGKCTEAIAYLTGQYDSTTGDIPADAIEKARAARNWDNDAFEAVCDKARRNAFVNDLNA